MKVTIIPIVIGTVTKGLLKGLVDLERGRVETIQTTALLRRPEYLASLKPQGKPSVNADVKTPKSNE